MRSACSTVESRWAIRQVMASRLAATSRIVWLISSSVSESRELVASSNTRSCGLRSRARAIDRRCFSIARDRQALLLAAGDLDAALADHRVQAAAGALQEALHGGLLQHFQALSVRGLGAHEAQVLADRAGE